MSFSTNDVKELRERTGAGMMDCKKALTETAGKFDDAVEWLRKKGLSAAAKKAGRIAAEGAVTSYIHGEGRIGVLVEINSETDFVAKTEQFQTFTKDIAMHIAATNPICVSQEDLPTEAVEAERRIFIGQAKEAGKKAEMIDRIVEGQIKKWSSDKCLMSQAFVKNPDVSIKDLLNETIAKIGENIVIRRFVRFELGEGIEKKKDNFASEVAAQAGL